MKEHLPECRSHITGAVYPNRDDVPWDEIGDTKHCWLCDILRACEQRVRLEDDDYSYVAAQAEAYGRRRGWNEALDAAEAAVLGVSVYRWPYSEPHDKYTECITVDSAVAAIDALKEKP